MAFFSIKFYLIMFFNGFELKMFINTHIKHLFYLLHKIIKNFLKGYQIF